MGASMQDELKRLNENGLLCDLLADRTTGRNIIWATNTYSEMGNGYANADEITPERLFQDPFVLKSRTDRKHCEQRQRTKTYAEVFTPFKIVKQMNDCVDNDWFGCEDPFATERVQFPPDKSWQDYVDSLRLEITCGEAPFLATRYDVTTGEEIPLWKRAGLLDRKLRIVSENTKTEEEWLFWAFRSYEATYGYEYQGDSLLLARINLVLTFEENLHFQFHREPFRDEYRRLLSIISWNIWQMDGLTGAIPCVRDAYNKEETHSEIPCRIFDWRENHSLTFASLQQSASA